MTKKVTVEGAEGAADDIWHPFRCMGMLVNLVIEYTKDLISPIGGSGLEQQEEE